MPKLNICKYSMHKQPFLLYFAYSQYVKIAYHEKHDLVKWHGIILFTGNMLGYLEQKPKEWARCKALKLWSLYSPKYSVFGSVANAKFILGECFLNHALISILMYYQ